MFETVLFHDVPVPARDGVALSTDIWLPALRGRIAPEPVPAILMRTPYGKLNPREGPKFAEFFVPRGYAFVCQDVRGLYRSGGTFGFLPQEGPDGADTIEWLAAQPWSNGKIGTIGCSYRAWAQIAAALERPPHLAAMVVLEGGLRAREHAIRNGGALEMRWLCWPFWNLAAAAPDPAVRDALNRVRVRDFFEGGRFQPGTTPLSRMPSVEELFWKIYTCGADDDFWRQPGWDFLTHIEQHARVPVLVISGWYDSYSRSAVEYFELVSRRMRAGLIMGPWVHGTEAADQTFAGELEFGPAASLGFLSAALEWFEEHLRGRPTARRPPVRLFVMGGGGGSRDENGRIRHGGRWIECDRWPPPGRALRLYLHEGGRLSNARPDREGSCSRFVSDPNRPVPTIGGNISSLDELRPPAPDHPLLPAEQREHVHLGLPGGWHQVEREGWPACEMPGRPLWERPDVLCFETDPLTEPLEAIGPVHVTLWVSASTPDADVTARLLDVYPGGPAINLCDGIVRLRFASSPAREELVPPGKVIRIGITPYPIANRFERGHRIRLLVAGSNFPRFDVNPNTGEPLWRHTRLAEAAITLYHEPGRPSFLELWQV